MEDFWSGREAVNLSKTPNIFDKDFFRFIFSSSLKIHTRTLLLFSLWEWTLLLLGNGTHLLQFLCDVDIWSSYKVVVLFMQWFFVAKHDGNSWMHSTDFCNNRWFIGNLHHLFQIWEWVSYNQDLPMDFTVCSKRHLEVGIN